MSYAVTKTGKLLHETQAWITAPPNFPHTLACYTSTEEGG